MAPRAAAVLRRLGYTQVHALAGGLAGWIAAGGEVFRDVNVPSKAFGEGIAAYFAHQEGLSALSVRIANFTTLSRGEQLSARDMSAFLSHRDAADLLDRQLHRLIADERPLPSVASATPKSVSHRCGRSVPEASSSRFAGLMSRWAIPRSCRAWAASAASRWWWRRSSPLPIRPAWS